jgi:uncharacterized membrane protein (DUF485 family)
MAQRTTAMNEAFERRKSIIGIRMTILYALVYGGFVGLSVFQPAWMGARAILGLNLAVAYGLGLILIAISFALIYNHLCRVSSLGTRPSVGAGSQSSSVSEPDIGQKGG